MAPRFAGVPVEQKLGNKPRFAGTPVSAAPSATSTGAPVLSATSPEFANLPVPGVMTPDPVDPRHGEWNEPGALVPVQFQQGTGAARLAVPGLVTDAISAITAPGKAARGEYDQVEVNTQTGAVSPFDPRMVNDAASLASMVSPVTPGATVAKSAGTVARQALPEIDDLYATKDAAYAAADKLGARYSPEAMDDLSGDMIRRAAEGNINPIRHEKAYSILEDLGKAPDAQSLTQIDQLRQTIRRDLVDPDPRSADAYFGKQFIAAIDDFIENVTPDKIRGMDPKAAGSAIKQAREANAVLRKSETVQEILDNARLSAAASGSGGNIDNVIRQGFARVLKSDKLSYGFSKDELAQMEKVVMGGGKMHSALRVLGKLSPQGNGLMAALGVGATAANPVMALGPITGIAAKTLSDRATQGNVNALTKLVRTGGNGNALGSVKQGNALTGPASTVLIEQNMPTPMSLGSYRAMPVS